MRQFFKFNTIDLDKVDHDLFEKIYLKICECKHHGVVMWKDTQKGYHILFKCDIECDKCRFVFDDQKRYSADLGRPECKKNVLFTPFSAHKKKVAGESKVRWGFNCDCKYCLECERKFCPLIGEV